MKETTIRKRENTMNNKFLISIKIQKRKKRNNFIRLK